MIDKNFLMYITDIASTIKAHTILLQENYIYGVDENYTYLKIVQVMNPNDIRLLYNVNDMKKFIKSLDREDIVYENDTLFSYCNTFINTFDIRLYVSIINLLNNINLIIQFPSAYTDNDIRNDINFESIISQKTGEGIGLYRIENKYIMALFNNLLPVNKADLVSLNIYNVDERKFLSHFRVEKKKNVIVDIYIMYLYLTKKEGII